MRPIHASCLPALLLVCLAGCTTAPDYKAPTVELPKAYKESSTQWAVAQPGDQLSRDGWWLVFQDPVLNALMAKGSETNFQLQAAVSRFNASKAFLAVNSAAQSPQVGLSGTGSNNRQSANRPLRGANQPDIYDSNQVSFVASYELDVWGRVRSSIDSATALSEAAFADTQTLRLLIRTEIASTYFQVRGLDTQISLIKDVLEAYRKQASIVRSRFEMGISSGGDYYRAQTLVENEEIRLQSLRTRRSVLEHALALLVGENASTFSLEAGDIFKIAVPEVPLSVPSRLLERRPDIASSERKVAASNADIGVARAAYFPVIGLAAQDGFQNNSTSSLINAPNRFWSIGPTAFLTLFDGGRRDALVDQAKARNEEATAVYKNTVLSAFKEVEDVLVDLKNREIVQKNVSDALLLSDKGYQIAIERYKEGVASYLEIVDASIQRTQSELTNVDQRTQLLVGRSSLVKVLGGYWD